MQLIPALIFAELMDRETKGNLAAAETLLSAGIIGIIYAIISGQPLTLLGITGPVPSESVLVVFCFMMFHFIMPTSQRCFNFSLSQFFWEHRTV